MSDISRLSSRRGHGPLESWLRRAMTRLTESTGTPRLDAELLAAHALGMTREEMILRLPDLALPNGLDELLERRLRHEPIAQIVGHRDFWTLTLKVTRDVLCPRPESETLIEAAIDHFIEDREPSRILDLGTGSGALLLSALDLWPEATGLGIDISEPALAIAHENAQATGLAERAQFRQGDWVTGLSERFDLILCNPPYIRDDAMLPSDVADYEPALALFGGEDGLDPYRILSLRVADLLTPGGVALFEIGFDQGESAANLFRGAFLDVELRRDLAGNARCLVVTGP
ncbi:MAG: peptide chain release factor N(5)-glutamine methyltransferase [Sphingobium sp.]|nr:peptide chain release factor N(5)-glutamine methyltransferase [Sphingobium sp.]